MIIRQAGGKWNERVYGPDAFQSPDEIAALLAGVARPFILIGDRELSVLRRGLTKHGWKRDLYLQDADPEFSPPFISGGGVLAQANAWLEREILIPGRAASGHHFFCEDGTRLELPSPGKNEFRCPACGSTYSGEPYEAASRWFEHSALAAGALLCGLLYGIEKDRAYSDKAAEILLAYAGTRSGPGPGGIIFDETEDEAGWIIRLAQAYDLIYLSRSLSERALRELQKSLFRPVADRLMQAGTDGSSGSSHSAAVGVIGLTIKDEMLIDHALKAFAGQISEQLGSDGIWPESCHTYHFSVLSAWVHFAEACYRAGIDLFDWQSPEGKSLRQMFLAPLNYVYPDFMLPAINDGWYGSYLPLDLYEIACRRWNDAAFAWAIKRGYRFGGRPVNKQQETYRRQFSRKSFYAFLFGRDLPGRVGEPFIASCDFPVLGICILRSGSGTMATFHYGPFLSRGQRDKMSFTLYGADHLLVPDYGTPGHGSEITHWYRSTAAHNTVVVDGKDQETTDENDVLEFHTGSFLQGTKAVTRQAYPGVSHSRQLLLTQNALYVVDDLSSADEHTYDMVLRAEGDFELETDLSLKAGSPVYGHLKDVKHAPAGDWSALWRGETYGLRTSVWQPEGSEMMTGSAPAETAARQVPLAISRQKGKTARFISCLLPFQVGAKTSCGRSGNLFSVSLDADDELLYLQSAGESDARNAELQTDAQIACLRSRDNQVLSCVLIGGSYVQWRSDVVLETSERVEWIEVGFEGRNPAINCSALWDGHIRLRTPTRAMRLNGHRVSASGSDGIATLRIHQWPLSQHPVEFDGRQ